MSFQNTGVRYIVLYIAIARDSFSDLLIENNIAISKLLLLSPLISLLFSQLFKNIPYFYYYKYIICFFSVVYIAYIFRKARNVVFSANNIIITSFLLFSSSTPVDKKC